MKRDRLSPSLVTAVLLLLAGCGEEASPHSNSSGIGGGAAGMTSAAAGESGAAGAGGSGGDEIPATFATVKLVFSGGGSIMTCAAAPCHGVGGMAPPANPLALPTNDDALLYTSLTSYVSSACNGMKLVVPGSPAESALIAILEGPCGPTPRMPYGCSDQAGDCIPAEYVAAVAKWIESGAPRE